jgi:5-methylcytosine-specific restriction protein A
MGSFAADMLTAMMRSTENERDYFIALVAEARAAGMSVELSIGGASVDASEPTLWPPAWATFDLTVSAPSTAVPFSAVQFEASAVRPTARCLLLALSLASEAQGEGVGESEGEPQLALSKRYERSRLNRAACVSVHGFRCAACYLDMAERYGEIAEGFIHVHHIVPLSLMGESYRLNPVSDLIPLCPNCHAIAHLRTPPLSPLEIRELFSRNARGPDQRES